jgi:alkylation response protein AidB-like acyl-CoA dehydrogenase
VTANDDTAHLLRESAAVQTRFEDRYVSGRKQFVVAAAADSVLLVSAVRGADLVWAAVDARSPQVRLQACAAGAHSVSTVHFDHSPVMFDEPLAVGVAAQSISSWNFSWCK